MIDCAEFEVLLADSMDGVLDAPGREADREAFARHLESCEACAAMAKEVRSAVAFMELAAEPEPPRELAGKILQATNSGWELNLRGKGIRGWINRMFAPVLRPRFVMGAMLTVMSLTMLTRCAAGPKSTMTAADLDPTRLWSQLDSRGHRVWDRAVKGYESMRLVYEIRTQISDWNKQQAADEQSAADAAANNRKLPEQPASGSSNDKKQ
jgi:predicted anti-sigma-YlaC factor YlaD